MHSGVVGESPTLWLLQWGAKSIRPGPCTLPLVRSMLLQYFVYIDSMRHYIDQSVYNDSHLPVVQVGNLRIVSIQFLELRRVNRAGGLAALSSACLECAGLSKD